MKRLALILSVSAMTMIASSQAQANYQIIRWTSGFCQIWDDSIPTKPFPYDYKPGRKAFKTFGEAWSAKMQLVARGECW